MRKVTLSVHLIRILKKGSINPDCKLLKPSYVDYKIHTSEMFDFLYCHRISPDAVISPIGGKGLLLALAYNQITRALFFLKGWNLFQVFHKSILHLNSCSHVLALS